MKILALVSQLFFVATSYAGHDVGNGGGFALCGDGKLYSYDYLVTKGGPETTRNSTLAERFKYIAFHLNRLQDPSAADFGEFVSILYQQIPGKKFQ